jgi:hypothetical protein
VFYMLLENHWRNILTDENIEALKKLYKGGGRELSLTKELTYSGITHPAQTYVGAWSDRDFGIAVSVKDKNIYDFSKKLVEAIKMGDYALWFGGENAGNPFGRAGLIVAIASMVPQDVRDYITKCDIDSNKLKEADERSGIKKLLKSKNKGYFACSPRWLTDSIGDMAISALTAYPIIYWLNPMDQKNNDHGWFTVEELTCWANDSKGNRIKKELVSK